MKKKLLTVILGVSIFGFTACNKLDVIGDRSIDSFDAILSSVDGLVTEDGDFGGWSIEAPDKTTRFLWSKDFSKTTTDLMIETDAKPFLEAGLDPGKLPEGMYVDDKIIVGVNLGEDALSYEETPTPLESYEQMIGIYRDNLGYHGAMDHFGIDLTGGNMFEWAKDMSENDKDIVFVLDPQIFIDAGVDTDKLQGWVFAKVTTMDSRGKEIQVDKFLKPFNLDDDK